jgi:hypothetical protein
MAKKVRMAEPGAWDRVPIEVVRIWTSRLLAPLKKNCKVKGRKGCFSANEVLDIIQDVLELPCRTSIRKLDRLQCKLLVARMFARGMILGKIT